MANNSELGDGGGHAEDVSPTVSTGVHPARAIAFLLASIALAAVCVAFALQYFVAERLPELTDSTLQTATERWQKNGPKSYDVEIELRGAQPGKVHVEVRDKEVELETRDGHTPGRWTWDTWSVPGLFDTLTQDLQISENPEAQIQAAPGTKWRLRCEFDPQLGYPLQYHRLVTGGPEVFWRVTSFQPK
jgi:hypothetical protein